MTTNKRKKVTKYRAHTTHGGGHRKKRRGAGSRGGRGNAGMGKRASHKVAGGLRTLGPKGFTPRGNKKGSKAINVSYFTLEKINKLLNKEKVVKEGEFYLIDLGKLGYSKLLGTGKTELKLRIKVAQFSPAAEEKIKAAGGEIVKEPSENKQVDSE